MQLFPNSQQEFSYFAPEDLRSMRQAFTRACNENPEYVTSQTRRDKLAFAILGGYQQNLDETELIDFALRVCSVRQVSGIQSINKICKAKLLRVV